MRIIIELSNNNPQTTLKIPLNYNEIISGIVYTTLKDKQYATKLHDHKGFKYFTISRIYMYNYRCNPEKNEFIIYDNKIKFQVSSPDNTFINQLMQGLLEKETLRLGHYKVKCTEIKIDEEPTLQTKTEYKTLSPILVRTQEIRDNKPKTIDLNPSQPQFYKQLAENITRKYNQYYNKEIYTPENINIYSNMRKVKGVRIALKSRNGITMYNRAYMMDINVEAPIQLQQFLYDTGLGERTAMGFGFIKIK